MAQTPEAKVKAKIKAILKAHGAYYAMPIGTGYGSSGVPDFLVCLNGEFLAIEAKAGKGTTTALQEKNLRQIEEAGGRTLVVNEETLELKVLEAVLENMK
jgi:Holliday junction resolvase